MADEQQRTAVMEAQDVMGGQNLFENDMQNYPALTPQKVVGSGSIAQRQGQTETTITGELVTARRVEVPRDIAAVMAEIAAFAARAGMRWVYRIPFKNNKTGQTDVVEGPTVKCTNSVFRAYGNCHLTTRIDKVGDHWIFYSRIVDLQKGTTMDRPFQQRIGQDTGMKDKARAEDMVFQIGVSKSQRNVVVNFLEDLVSFAVEEAKKGVLERVKKNPTGAKDWIMSQLAKLEVDVARVTRVYGRSPDNWTVFDMAKLFGEINAIDDGMVLAEDIYPSKAAEQPAPVVVRNDPNKAATDNTKGPSPAEAQGDAQSGAGTAAAGAAPAQEPAQQPVLSTTRGPAPSGDKPAAPAKRGRVSFED